MNKILLAAILLLTTAMTGFASGESVVREHRAIWFSPMLGSWPGGAVGSTSVESSKSRLRKTLTRLHDEGINTVYYHVRAHCDAAYISSYEPMSASVASGRGGTTAIDPLGCFVEVAHELGIEVYAWVNPYRYSAGGNYGAGELNYENSHPDWLMNSSEQKILNPGLPEVRQRVADVCSEIATNYDIDGMIFDDYFYHSSIGFSADADLYNQYKAAGGTLDQGSWRRDNVNQTIELVRNAVKAARPYTVFSIGPAGRISPDNIADYGLEPGPYGDMNYTGLYADPIYWLSQGWLDFLSPQVYWHSYFDKLTDWYSVVLPHFGRHLYTSVDCSRLNNNSSEYIRQIEYMRSHVRPNESGVVFFDYGAYADYREKYNGRSTRFGDILRAETFPYNALSPIHHWRADNNVDRQIGAVVRQGSTLSWTAAAGAGAEGRRYAVYAIEADADRASFACQPEYLVTVVYTESYEIPDDDAAKTYAVAVYDRYSNLHGARFEGSASLAAGTAPTALSSGACPALGTLSWTHAPRARYQVEISADASFSSLLGVAETTEDAIVASNVADLTAGTEYFWRVKAYEADHSMAMSAVSTIVPSTLAVTAPVANATDLTTMPVITWSGAAAGAEYTLQLADNADFTDPVFTTTTTATTFAIPERTLSTGKFYWIKLSAAHNGATVQAPVVRFATADRSDYTAPALLTPASDGVTLHADECIAVQPWDGMTNVYIEISSSESFAPRSTSKQTLTGFATEGKALGEVKILSKNLTAGETYYVRVRGGYALQSAQGVKYTAYGPVRSFVYSDQAGVFAPDVDTAVYIDAAAVLHLPVAAPVTVYDLAGRTVATFEPTVSANLSTLGAGVYIVRANNTTLKWVK